MENGPFIDGLPIKNCDFLYVKLPEGIYQYGHLHRRIVLINPMGFGGSFCHFFR